MIRLEALTAAHVAALDPQDAQAIAVEERMSVAMAQAGYGPAWAVLAGNLVIAVGGICDSWAGRGIGWSGLSRHAGPHMVALTRAIVGLHESLRYRRIEMFVAVDHPEALRWARLLKFHNETPQPMQNFLPDGGAAYLFARVFAR